MSRISKAGIAFSVSLAVTLILDLSNRWYFSFVKLYFGQEAAGTLASVLWCAFLFICYLLILLVMRRLRINRGVTFIVEVAFYPLVGVVGTIWFYNTSDIVKLPDEFDRRTLARIFPISYGLIFASLGSSIGLLARILISFLLTKSNVETIKIDNTQFDEEKPHKIYTAATDAVCNVIFVHGIHGGHKTTWHPDGKPAEYWPRWIGEELKDVNVYSIQYDAYATAWLGTTMPLEDRAKNIHDMLESHGLFDLPVIFVAHSFGGLVVKQLWRYAENFGKEGSLKSIKAVMFIATPHNGSLWDILDFFLVRYLARATPTAEQLKSVRKK